MSEFVRLGQYTTLLGAKQGKTRGEVMAALEISSATFKRDIAKLRDQMEVPVHYDRDSGRYSIDASQHAAPLPGLWFKPEEILALLTMQHLLSQLEPGLLGPKLKPLQERLAHLMESNGLRSQDVAQRMRIVHAGKRRIQPSLFRSAASATMARKRMNITHMKRETGETIQREISPQRMVHYRDNWYVDAWCHLRDDLRSFSVDAIRDFGGCIEVWGGCAGSRPIRLSDKGTERLTRRGRQICLNAVRHSSIRSHRELSDSVPLLQLAGEPDH